MKKKLLTFMLGVVASVVCFLLMSVNTFAYTSSEGSSDFGYFFNYNGYAQRVSLSELQGYYLDYDGSTKESSNKYEGKYKNYYQINECTYVRSEDPITAFVSKSNFTTAGDYVLLGDEYGYYVHTENAYVPGGSSCTVYEGEAFFSEVFLMDFTHTFQQVADNKGHFFEARLIADTGFVTIKKAAFDRNKNGVRLWFYNMNQYYDRGFAIDSDYKINSGSVTIPVVENSVQKNVGPIVMGNIKMYKPQMTFAAKDGIVGSLTLLTTPSSYSPVANADNRDTIISYGKKAANLAAGCLPSPYKEIAKGAICVGNFLVNGSVKNQRTENVGTATKNLDPLCVDINSESYECDFDTAFRTVNQNKNQSLLDAMFVFESDQSANHVVFKTKTEYSGSVTSVATYFDCSFLYTTYSESGVIFVRKKTHVAVTGASNKRNVSSKSLNAGEENPVKSAIWVNCLTSMSTKSGCH